MKIRILEDAEKDLDEGRRFYESQSPGLGAYFLDSLFSDIDSLILYAGVHRVVFGKYFRLLSKRFPFVCLLYYRGIVYPRPCRARWEKASLLVPKAPFLIRRLRITEPAGNRSIRTPMDEAMPELITQRHEAHEASRAEEHRAGL